jgi:hypothetical protein
MVGIDRDDHAALGTLCSAFLNGFVMSVCWPPAARIAVEGADWQGKRVGGPDLPM